MRDVLTAGEALHVTPSVEALFPALPGCVLWNQYGPTETHLVTAYRMDGPPRDWARVPPIGTCIDAVHVHVVDADLRPVASRHRHARGPRRADALQLHRHAGLEGQRRGPDR